MANELPVRPADIHGASRLAIEATLGIADLVEALHEAIAHAPWLFGLPSTGRTAGITGLVYASVRGITQLVGNSIDLLLVPAVALLGDWPASPERDAVIAALNGVLGDHLAAGGNPLATPMRLCHAGQPLTLTAPALAEAIPQASSQILLLAHGLCLNERSWQRNGHDHGAALAADLGATPVYVRYNTGRHISTNGRELAAQIGALIAGWPAPVQSLTIVGHSMGGLVARSAWHYGAAAGQVWPQQVRALACLGSPHHGAPLERGGNGIDLILGANPYTAPFARLGHIRSAGITDLRHGSLLDEDWAGRSRFAHPHDLRSPLPLPQGPACYAVGATTGETAGDLRDLLIGDGLVPLGSALGAHRDPMRHLAFPAANQWVGYGMNHMDLLDHPEVYAQLRDWLA